MPFRDPKFGEVVPDLTLLVPFTTANGFNWAGYGLPGDSGSGVMNDAGLAVGDLTHGLSVSGVPVPGLSFGTDMQGIFNLIGTGGGGGLADGANNNRVGVANPGLGPLAPNVGPTAARKKFVFGSGCCAEAPIGKPTETNRIRMPLLWRGRRRWAGLRLIASFP